METVFGKKYTIKQIFQDHYADWYYGKIPQLMTLGAYDFITRLTQHIPPKYFRLIKHYGILNNRLSGKFLPLLKEMFGKIKTFIKQTTWVIRQTIFTGNPILCPICQKEMQPVELAYWSKKLNRLKIIPVLS